MNCGTTEEDSPLYLAAQVRRRDLFEMLLRHGARVASPEDPEALLLNPESPGKQSFDVARDRWTIAWTGSVETEEGPLTRVSILKNGAVQERLLSTEYADIASLAVRRVRLPVPFPVIAARWHSGAGHGEETRFYAIRHGRLVRMLTMSHNENGGPVLRRRSPGSPPEWVWDDNNWYTYYGRGPAFLLAYRLTPDGRLVPSRRIPNPSRKPLPRVLGEEMLQ